MRIKRKMFYCLSGLLLFAGNVFSESAVVPFVEKDEIVLFDADRNGEKDFVNYTIAKGSDMIPQLSTVENDKGKWINFSYRGREGAQYPD